MMNNQKEFALYKGDEMLAIGTISEIAKIMNVNEKTIYTYSTNSYKKRIRDRKNPQEIRELIPID